MSWQESFDFIRVEGNRASSNQALVVESGWKRLERAGGLHADPHTVSGCTVQREMC